MVAIRELQQYLYCPHRWQMIYREDQWQENYATAWADLIHERAHSGEVLVQSERKVTLASVTIYSERYGVYGKTDLLELVKDPKGTPIPGYPDRYRVSVIEYKPTSPKGEAGLAERLQLYAQTLCVNELFACNAEGYLYFADTKKRVRIHFSEEEKVFHQIVEAIRSYREGETLFAEYGKKCSGCSMKERCMPKASQASVRSVLLEEI